MKLHSELGNRMLTECTFYSLSLVHLGLFSESERELIPNISYYPIALAPRGFDIDKPVLLPVTLITYSPI